MCFFVLFVIDRTTKVYFFSLFGSQNFLSGSHLLFCLKDFKFLPYSVHVLHVLTLFRISLLQKGNQTRFSISVIPQLPGWFEWNKSMTAFLIVLGIATLLSMKMHPFLMFKFCQCACICFDNAEHLCLSFSPMQSRTLRMTVSRFVSAATNFELNKFLICLSVKLVSVLCCLSSVIMKFERTDFEGDFDSKMELLCSSFYLHLWLNRKNFWNLELSVTVLYHWNWAKSSSNRLLSCLYCACNRCAFAVILDCASYIRVKV